MTDVTPRHASRFVIFSDLVSTYLLQLRCCHCLQFEKYQFDNFLTLHSCTFLSYLLDQLIGKMSSKISWILMVSDVLKKFRVGGLKRQCNAYMQVTIHYYSMHSFASIKQH